MLAFALVVGAGGERLDADISNHGAEVSAD
jgi:hypothetical protein